MFKSLRATPSCFAGLAFATLAACSGTAPSGQREVSGQFALTSYALDNARVVAHAADGSTLFAALDAAGRFRLRLPTGQRYTLALANSRNDGTYREISTLAFTAASGRARGFDLKAGGAIDLGVIRPLAAGAPLSSTSHGSDDPAGGDHSGEVDGGSGSSSSDDSADTSEDDSPIPACVKNGRADLPYDVRPQVGQTFRLSDAFLARGPKPAAIVAVQLGDVTWRATELAADSPFTITADDCTHTGNRDVGRDRIVVRWQNADGSVDEDHLDLRYCKSGGGSSSPSSSAPVADSTCSGGGDDDVCVDASASDSACEHEQHDGLTVEDGVERHGCDDTGAVVDQGKVDQPAADDHKAGEVCVVTSDCAAPLACVASTCQTVVF